MGIQEKLAAMKQAQEAAEQQKKEAAEKAAAEKAKAEKEARRGELSLEREKVAAEVGQTEQRAKDAEDALAEADAFAEAQGENLAPEARGMLEAIRAEAAEAKQGFEQKKSELERIDAELAGLGGGKAEVSAEAAPAEAAEEAVEEKAEAPAEVGAAEVAVETPISKPEAETAETAKEAPKTPEESLENLNALTKEIAAAVKESKQVDFEKIEDAGQKLEQLKGLREKILSALNETIEAHQAAGNLKMADRIFTQSLNFLEKTGIDNAVDMYARKANGLTKVGGALEYQLQSEYSGKEAEAIIKRFDLGARLQPDGSDSSFRDSAMLTYMDMYGGLSGVLSPEAIRAFEARKNDILRNNIQQASHFDKVSSEISGEKIRLKSNLDARDADNVAKINLALERSKEAAERRRSK